MSLISVQNFLAPFKSPTNIITLVLVAVLFGFFRASGGSVRLTDRGPARIEDTSSDIDEDAIAARVAEQNAEDEAIVRKDSADRRQKGALNDILGREEETGQPHRTNNDLDSMLSDIEKKYGMK